MGVLSTLAGYPTRAQLLWFLIWPAQLLVGRFERLRFPGGSGA